MANPISNRKNHSKWSQIYGFWGLIDIRGMGLTKKEL
jgi:hypothetical protein